MLTHLCTRTYYSLLDGTMSVEELVSLAKKNDMKALAITERHVLYSALEFQKECDKQGIKPIFGMEITIEEEDQIFDSLIIAKNIKGYQGLIHSSKILLKNKKLSYSDLNEYRDDIIFIVYSENGPFENDLRKANLEQIKEKLNFLNDYFPNFYLGISHQESSYFKKINHTLLQIADLLGLKSLAIPKVYYKSKEDDESLRILHAIKKGTFYDDKTLVSAPDRYFYSKEEMSNLYRKDLLENIEELVSSVSLDLKKIKTKLPEFKAAKDIGSDVYLRQLSHLGLRKRLNGNISHDYQKRLDFELETITSMDFSDYFLIVYDVIRFAKKNGIYVGPGRGSSAGSLVAYSLGITEVDPLKYGLYFERFLNPSRKEMPDIDIDFPDDRRDEVIEYVQDTYGLDHVAHIVTFGTMKARQAFRDVARVFQMPLYQVDKIAKLISSNDLMESYNNSSAMQRAIAESELNQKIFNYALKIEGLPRHSSVHAAGIVLSKKPLDEIVPYFIVDDLGSIIQFDMSHLEEMGLIKIDFLGLRNLSIIDNIRKDIPDLDIVNINLDDKKTFDLICRGETLGLFQLESDGMTQLLKDMQPNRFMDLVDAIALYRPGPMENIPVYLENRQNPDKIKYLHDDLEMISKTSYGILIYQEQIMQVAQIMAGFSLARADILRKAMSQKNSKNLESLKIEFIEGALNLGYEEKLVHEVFNLIMKFANYGFNKSHSVAYALIAYQMAYLKAHYPLMFYKYLLNSVQSSNTRTQQYLNECKSRGIQIVNPSINYSSDAYRLLDDKIVLPLTLAKGISKTVSSHIVKEREDGRFSSYYNAISRLSINKINKGNFVSLIDSGAFDEFGKSRLAMKENLEEALTYSSLISIKNADGISLNYSLVSEPNFKDLKENLHDKLNNEKNILGFYLSDHPARTLQEKHKTDQLSEIVIGRNRFKVIAMVDRIKKYKTKKGDTMAFLRVSDASREMDAIVFPNLYVRVEEHLEIGAIIYIKANMREADKIIIEDLYRFEY